MTPKRSFFRTVTDYERTPDRDPGEDRLTQAFAALLESVDGLAAWIFAEKVGETRTEWRKRIEHEDLGVETQVWIPGAGRLDLRLRFGSSFHIRIEIKGRSQADLSGGGDQLNRYAKDFDGPLCLLAPFGYDIPELAKPKETELVRMTWQGVGERIQQFRGGDGGQEPNAKERWLVDQFLHYLREERLMTDRLNTGDVATLLSEESENAIGSVETFLKALQEEVEKRFEERTDGQFKSERLKLSPAGKPWPARYTKFKPRDYAGLPQGGKYKKSWMSKGRNCWIEWRIGGSSGEPGALSQVSAGLGLPKRKSDGILSDVEQRSKLEEESEDVGLLFIERDLDDHYPWFLASAPLADLLEEAGDERSFDEQVAFVAEWIVERMTRAAQAAGMIK